MSHCPNCGTPHKTAFFDMPDEPCPVCEGERRQPEEGPWEGPTPQEIEEYEAMIDGEPLY